MGIPDKMRRHARAIASYFTPTLSLPDSPSSPLSLVRCNYPTKKVPLFDKPRGMEYKGTDVSTMS
jgi:hypothetical protein